MNDTNTAWRSSTDADGIVWLTLDKPGTSANVLSSAVLIELDALLRPLQQSAPRGVVVSSAKKSGFVAGADIKEFTGLTDAESGYQTVRRFLGDRHASHMNAETKRELTAELKRLRGRLDSLLGRRPGNRQRVMKLPHRSAADCA